MLLRKADEQLGNIPDIRLVEEEIKVKRREIANSRLETALHDARVLLLVRSFESAQSVLDTVSELVPYADNELAQQFAGFLQAARSGAAQSQIEEPEAPKNPTIAPPLQSPGMVDLNDKTQLADPGQLEAILGEITIVADHYPDDSKVQTAIEDIRTKITTRITEIREAGLPQEPQPEIQAVPGDTIAATQIQGIGKEEKAAEPVAG